MIFKRWSAPRQSARVSADLSLTIGGDMPIKGHVVALERAALILLVCFGPDALSQQAASTQQSAVAQNAPGQVPARASEPAIGKPAEAVPAKPANDWRAVSTRQPGEALKITLKNGGVVKGKFRSSGDDGLVLEMKNKELSLGREEIATVSVPGKKSAGKAAVIGMAIGGGVGAGAGAGYGGAQRNSFVFTRGQSAALGAGIFGGIGAAGGGLIGFAAGHAGHRETMIYQAP
jgi:hypothetical protein